MFSNFINMNSFKTDYNTIFLFIDIFVNIFAHLYSLYYFHIDVDLVLAEEKGTVQYNLFIAHSHLNFIHPFHDFMPISLTTVQWIAIFINNDFRL